MFGINSYVCTYSISGEVAKARVPRMYYKNFDNNITAKYGVVLEGWPLDRFCSPSDIASRTEISALRSSFESGATRFRMLSRAELEAWSDARFQATLSTTTTFPAATPQPSPQSSLLQSSQNSSGPGVDTNATLDSHMPPEHGTIDTTDTSNLETPPEPGVGMTDISNSQTPSEPGVDMTDISSQTTGTMAPTIPTAVIPAKRVHETPSGSRQPLTTNFVNLGVTSINGAAVVVTKKPRKERSDKGKKRGKRASAKT
jgi:hypothetical protein